MTAPRVRMPEPPAPPVQQIQRQKPTREMNEERSAKRTTRAARRGRSALRIDLAPGANTSGATGLNVPRT